MSPIATSSSSSDQVFYDAGEDYERSEDYEAPEDYERSEDHDASEEDCSEEYCDASDGSLTGYDSEVLPDEGTSRGSEDVTTATPMQNESSGAWHTDTTVSPSLGFSDKSDEWGEQCAHNSISGSTSGQFLESGRIHPYIIR